MQTRRRNRDRDGLLTLLIFLSLLAIYALSPIRTSYDSRWSIPESMSFVHGHDGNLSEYQSLITKETAYSIQMESGKPYSTYPIGASVLAVPFVAVMALVQPSFEERLKERIPVEFEAFVASFYGALAAVVFFRLVLYRWSNTIIALASTFIFSLCTPMWSTATRALWQHGPLVLTLLIAMTLLLRARARPDLIQYVGLPLAAAFVIRPTAAVPIAIITLYVLAFYWKWILRYFLWASLIAIPWVSRDLLVYDAILPPYYQAQHLADGSQFSSGVLGTLVSPARGLFVYAPVLVLAFSGFGLSLRETSERWLNCAFMACAVGIWLVVSHSAMWWGGHSYGPRLMTDALPFLAYFVSFNFPPLRQLAPNRKRAALLGIVALALPSLLVSGEGALLYGPYLWNLRPQNVDQARDRLWDWKDPPFLRISRR